MTWDEFIKNELSEPYAVALFKFLKEQYDEGKKIYPPCESVFRAFHLTPFDKVKIVIIGQDPYFNYGQANGLAFSVNKGTPLPPSLKNIFYELSIDCCMPFPEHGDLTKWAEQGVLLLNRVLTVEEGKPNGHANRGWETFTYNAVSLLSKRSSPPLFVLWGQKAQQLCDIQMQFHLAAPHPSPFSAHAGFFGCKHFSKINQWLKRVGWKEIDWSL